MGTRTEKSEAERIGRALQAHLREEFTAPAASITGFAEIAVEETARQGMHQYRADLSRIRDAGQNLQECLDQALAQKEIPQDIEGYRSQLRHDLRTPINAAKGYAEILIEDAANAGHTSVVSDLRKLLEAVEGMLERIDALVAFTVNSDPEAAKKALPAAARVMTSISDPEAGQRARRITGSILVVDDNEANRELLARRLTREGHTVVTVRHGAAALTIAQNGGLDLILLDILMPDISGFSVLATLKADPRTREIPVIMISALDDVPSIVRCIEGGAADFVAKPLEPALMRTRLQSCLENKFLRDRERAMLEEIKAAKEKNESLLLNILPKPVVERIQTGEIMVADHIDEATIIFADLADFTPLSLTVAPVELVGLLNKIFSAFDNLTQRFGAEKIKTIGDCYMAAIGVPEPRRDSVELGAALALAMRDEVAEMRASGRCTIGIRIGMHCGPVVAGVIGLQKFAYDIWGTTVNMASRMESHGETGRIHVTETFARRVEGKFGLVPRGAVKVKDVGLVNTFFLER